MLWERRCGMDVCRTLGGMAEDGDGEAVDRFSGRTSPLATLIFLL